MSETKPTGEKPKRRSSTAKSSTSSQKSGTSKPTPKTPSTCSNCKFFEQSRFQTVQGICRRFPVVGNKHINEWCGEHQK